MPPKPCILISGVGRIGVALAQTIAPTQQAEIALWDIDSRKIAHSFPPQQLAETADFILLCVPSTAAREFVESVKNNIKPAAVVVSLIKGLDPQGLTMHELLRDLVPRTANHLILGGPMLSGEMMIGRGAFGAVAGERGVYEKLASLLAPTILHVEYSDDPQGVSVAGVLKNIYALGLGLAAALQVGDNAQGYLVTQALREMEQLMVELGGKAKTLYGLAGIGDFIATGFSQHSRNRTVGQELVMRGRVSIPSEGLLTLPILLKRLSGDIKPYQFLGVIKHVVVDQESARESFQSIF